MWKAFFPGAKGIFPYFGFSVFFAAALYMTVDAIRVEHDIMSWRQAPARVTGKAIVEAGTSSGTGENRQPTYSVFVPYRFTVQGKQYKGRWVQMFPQTLSGNEKNALVKKYRKGKAITISYDPNNPHRSAIAPTSDLSSRKTLGIVIMILVLVVYAVTTAIKIYLTWKAPSSPKPISKGLIIGAAVMLLFIGLFISVFVYIISGAKRKPRTVQDDAPVPITASTLFKGVSFSLDSPLNVVVRMKYNSLSSQLYVFDYVKNPTNKPYVYNLSVILKDKNGQTIGSGSSADMGELGAIPPGGSSMSAEIAFPVNETMIINENLEAVFHFKEAEAPAE